MNRHPQWPERLHELVAEHFDKPYRWGEHDCLLFLGKAIEAVTGEDRHSAHRGEYKSQASAFRRLHKLGHDSPESFLNALLEQKPVGFAQRGDIVMGAEGIPMLCLGGFAVCIGDRGDGTEGMFRVPRASWVKAWAVGEHHSSWPDE